MVFDQLFAPILDPLLALPPVLGILIISAFIAVITTLAYKFVTDQKVMKALKEDMKKFRKKMKGLKDDPKKMMETQKQAMEKQMQYMMHSLKPTFITILPLLLIFGWLNANLAYEPIQPDVPFNVTAQIEAQGEVQLDIVQEGLQVLSENPVDIDNNKAQWQLQGEAGEYQLEFIHDGNSTKRNVIITTQQQYADPIQRGEEPFNNLIVEHKKTTIFTLFGWDVGWLITYIIFVMIFSTLLRKGLGVH